MPIGLVPSQRLRKVRPEVSKVTFASDRAIELMRIIQCSSPDFRIDHYVPTLSFSRCYSGFTPSIKFGVECDAVYSRVYFICFCIPGSKWEIFKSERPHPFEIVTVLGKDSGTSNGNPINSVVQWLHIASHD